MCSCVCQNLLAPFKFLGLYVLKIIIFFLKILIWPFKFIFFRLTYCFSTLSRFFFLQPIFSIWRRFFFIPLPPFFKKFQRLFSFFIIFALYFFYLNYMWELEEERKALFIDYNQVDYNFLIFLQNQLVLKLDESMLNYCNINTGFYGSRVNAQLLELNEWDRIILDHKGEIILVACAIGVVFVFIPCVICIINCFRS